MLNSGLLLLRLVLGLILAGHGAQKLFGWFGGHGMNGTRGMVTGLGMRPAWFWALIAGFCEFGGGLLLALGLLSPLGALGIIAAMLTAIIRVHWSKGFWNTKGGIEFPLVNLSAAAALALTGPGLYSLDNLFGIVLPEPLVFLVGLVIILAGFLVLEFTRQQPVKQPVPTDRSSQAGRGGD